MTPEQARRMRLRDKITQKKLDKAVPKEKPIVPFNPDSLLDNRFVPNPPTSQTADIKPDPNYIGYPGHADQQFGPVTYSHCGEDIMVCNLFDMMGIKKPTYLDIGAHHPFTISNTALLYHRGSRGVNIEANPNLIDLFKLHRPEDKNVNIGIALQAGMHTFYMWNSYSGRNTFSKEWGDKLEVKGGETELECITIHQALEQHCGGVWPDLLTIDIEGLDYDVLRTANFSKNRPKIICAEIWKKESVRFRDMMDLQGFAPYSRHHMDVIFIDKQYCDITAP